MVCRPHTGQLIVQEFAQDNFVHKNNTTHRMTYYVYFALDIVRFKEPLLHFNKCFK